MPQMCWLLANRNRKAKYISASPSEIACILNAFLRSTGIKRIMHALVYLTLRTTFNILFYAFPSKFKRLVCGYILAKLL